MNLMAVFCGRSFIVEKKKRKIVLTPEVYWAGQITQIKIQVSTTVSRPGASSGGAK